MYSFLNAEVLPQLIPPNSRILTAVSGGPDSVALTHILGCYRRDNPDQNLFIIVSHVNHKVRKEAEDEAELVRKLAGQWGFPFILHEFDSKDNAYKCRKSFQEASREWRYARWQEDMEKWGCNLLATAHHLGDQAETVLFRLIRGSGTAGLAGIYPSKDGIIRPLLSVTKKAIIDYCHAQGLVYAIDKSNFEPLYDRNKIRLTLLPQLEKEYNYKIQEALGRTAELLRWDEEYISSQVEKVWNQFSRVTEQGYVVLAHDVWDQPEAVLSRLLRKAAAEISGEPRGLEYKYVKMIMKEGKKTNWRQDLPGIKVESQRNGFFFFRGELVLKDKQINYCLLDGVPQNLEIPLLPRKWYSLPGIDIQVGIFDQILSEQEILYSTEFDMKKILALDSPLVCRMRRSGDRMYFEKFGHKNIKKVFQEKKISVKERGLIPLFAHEHNIVWIPGVCRSDSFIPDRGHLSKFYGLVSKK